MNTDIFWGSDGTQTFSRVHGAGKIAPKQKKKFVWMLFCVDFVTKRGTQTFGTQTFFRACGVLGLYPQGLDGPLGAKVARGGDGGIEE